jgi:hypothetical protein
MSRDRIDWDTLKPLPRRKRVGADRELLAEVRFNRQKAKHKGRNHISNAKRRQLKVKAAKDGKARAAANRARFGRYVDAVRAYWSGESDEHPTRD